MIYNFLYIIYNLATFTSVAVNSCCMIPGDDVLLRSDIAAKKYVITRYHTNLTKVQTIRFSRRLKNNCGQISGVWVLFVTQDSNEHSVIDQSAFRTRARPPGTGVTHKRNTVIWVVTDDKIILWGEKREIRMNFIHLLK